MRFSTSIAALLHLAAGIVFAQEYRVSTLVGGIPPVGPLPALQVTVGHVGGVATDRPGNVYFSSLRGCVFELDTEGGLWRVAGTCQSGYSGDGGPATAAELGLPQGLAVDSYGSIYIADSFYCVVRKVTRGGSISTIAGDGFCRPGSSESTIHSDELSYPAAIAVDAGGNVFIAESDRIRELSPGGGLITAAVLSSSAGLALDAAGNLYAAAGSQVFHVAGGQATAYAGIANLAGDTGDGGPALSATFGGIIGLAIDSAGETIVADGTVRSISPDGVVQTVAGTTCCAVAGVNQAWGGNSGALAVDGSGNIYVGILLGDVLRKISPQGLVADVAGTDNPTYVGDNGPAMDAELSSPQAVAVDSSGNVYIADYGNSRVRKISKAGVITTVAGNGISGFSGDGGPATRAQLAGPDGLAIDAAGNLFVSEYLNNRVREITPDGIITTVAGSGQCCNLGDGGPATAAFIPLPHGVAVDRAGNLYVAEWPDSRIRKVTQAGVISTYAGTGTRGFSGDGGPASEAQLNLPWGLAVDGDGNLFLADNQNLRVRAIAPDGIITTIAGGPSSTLPLDTPTGVAVDSAGNVLTSGGWRISTSGTQSLIDARAPSGRIVVSGVGIASDARGDLFLVSGNRVLGLQPADLRLPKR